MRFGFPDSYFDGYAAKVRHVTVADTVEAAKVIHPDRLAWVIAGDRAKIEAGLKELGLGEVHEIDADGHVVE